MANTESHQDGHSEPVPFNWDRLRHDLRFAIADAKAGREQDGAKGNQTSAQKAYFIPNPTPFALVMEELFGPGPVERGMGPKPRATNVSLRHIRPKLIF